jgi:acetyl-CoA C-acetyltransferase
MKKLSRDVYMVAGGVTKFARAHPDKTFQIMVKESFDAAIKDIPEFISLKEKLSETHEFGGIGSYFSDHFTRQLMAGIMAHEYMGMCPSPGVRVEGGGASGGLCVQEGIRAVASGDLELCVCYGFETMSRVPTWSGNYFIAKASDQRRNCDLGGFYSMFYALMADKHMNEFGIKREQLAKISIKNHMNALHNPYAQYPRKLKIEDVLNSEPIATPFTALDICTMSDGAAVLILASHDIAYRLTDRPVKIIGIGAGTDRMAMEDRPRRKIPVFPWEASDEELVKYYGKILYPDVHSFNAGRIAAQKAYTQAGITNPLEQLDFLEIHDAYTMSEAQTYEDLGLCPCGYSGKFIEKGYSFMPELDYGLELPEKGKLPVNPSGGLLACGHPIGATGIMQAVFSLWQLQHRIAEKFGDDILQVKNAQTGGFHSHAGTGTYITLTLAERAW